MSEQWLQAVIEASNHDPLERFAERDGEDETRARQALKQAGLDKTYADGVARASNL